MVRQTQQSLCKRLAELDGGSFRQDPWERAGGGGGLTCVMQDSTVFEKAGVNTAVVWGQMPRSAARHMGGGQRLRSGEGELAFYAAGVSVVIHPRNPFAPTAHCNYRYFEIGGADDDVEAWWFGGGADLTPSYLFEEDARHFHSVHKKICDRHDETYYWRFKKWCDEYFYLPHRKETRGVGGIFFDDLHQKPVEELLAFAGDCAAGFSEAYLPLVERRHQTAFAEGHRRWQQLRRGRYVEFNLLHDRGTAFGLNSDGRVESILMSLPLAARWEYDAQPPPGSEEARLLAVLRQPRDWVEEG